MTQTGHITVAEAAAILGVSRWTVVRRIKRGELLAEKLGPNTGAWLLNRADVERPPPVPRRTVGGYSSNDRVLTDAEVHALDVALVRDETARKAQA